MNRNIRILLVDDDQDDRTFFFDAVKEFDDSITCISASNGQEGLLYLKNEQNPLPDYIFLDLRMPGLSGQKCLEEIKKDRRTAVIPVIVYSTSREVKDSVELKKSGAAHFMSKPTLPDDIYYMIAVVLSEDWSLDRPLS